MSRKVMVFIATSLDGYIATEDDSLDWLFKVEGEGDNGYSEFYETVDTIILGRRTYDWIMNVEKENFPYKNKKCYVFTRSRNEPNDYVEFVDGDIVELINSLKRVEGKNIWIVGGGDLLAYFFKENLVDELIITIAPTIIGTGIPLFKKQNIELELELKSVRRFNQFAELHYVKKEIIHRK
ncbi:MAG: dihydrofolate reductase family protein [Clostridiales bacterium]|nr:dihydrofolate reductase family protein [Clostridiales bacterium]